MLYTGTVSFRIVLELSSFKKNIKKF